METVLSNLNLKMDIDDFIELANKMGINKIELCCTGIITNSGIYFNYSNDELDAIKTKFKTKDVHLHSLVFDYTGTSQISRFGSAGALRRLGSEDMSLQATEAMITKKCIDVLRKLGGSLLRINFKKLNISILKSLGRYSSYITGGGADGFNVLKIACSISDQKIDKEYIMQTINYLKVINYKSIGLSLDIGENANNPFINILINEFNQAEFNLNSITSSSTEISDSEKVLIKKITEIYDGECILTLRSLPQYNNLIQFTDLLKSYSFNTSNYDYLKYSYPSSVARILRNSGTAEISPEENVHAGQLGSWTYKFYSGHLGINTGGGIIIRFHHSSNWHMQMSHPEKPDYVSVNTSSTVELNKRIFFSDDACISLEIIIKAGTLLPGEVISVIFGDTSGGCPGTYAQTYQQEKLTFFTAVDTTGYGNYFEMIDPPYINIIGASAVKIRASAPTVVLTGKAFQVSVRIEDEFANLADSFKGRLRLRIDGNIAEETDTIKDASDCTIFHIKNIVLLVQGLHRFEVEDVNNKLKPCSFYIKCVNNEDSYKIFWGDIHGHTGLMDSTGTASNYLNYARNISFLDFCCLSEHMDNFSDLRQATNDYQWDEIKSVTRKYNEPDRFVTILGYENSVKWDANVYFPNDDAPWYVDSSAYGLFKFAREYKALVIPHMTSYPRFERGYDWMNYDPATVPAIEIYSTHGASERFGGEKPLSDCESGGYAVDALDMGLKIGFIGSSDGHDCMPGNDLWGKYINGLVAVFAKELSRVSILEAIRLRKCYATTNDRIVAWFDINGHMMGSDIYEAKGSLLNINVSLYGTDNIEYTDLVKNGRILYSVKNCGTVCEFTYEDRAEGNEQFGHNYYYVRMKQENGGMAWLSPIFVSVM